MAFCADDRQARAVRSGHSVHVSGVIAVVKYVLVSGEDTPANRSFEDYAPQSSEHFGVWLQVFIGAADDDLADSFDIVVCSPSWMSAKVDRGEWDPFRNGGLWTLPESVAVGSGIWFMRRWDRAAVTTPLSPVCEAASPGPDWGSVAARIGRLIPWEFDYKYDAQVNKNSGLPSPGS
jgi:Immunity protein 8